MSLSSFPFAIVHADTRTSRVLSFTGFKYYLVLIDDYSNYIWTYALHHKYDVFYHFVQFHNMVQTQFSTPTKPYNVIMVVNSKTTTSPLSGQHMAFSLDFIAHIPLNRMVTLNA